MDKNRDWKAPEGSATREEAQDALWRVLDEWPAPEPGAAFDARVMERVRAEAEGVQRPGGWQALVNWLGGGRGWAVTAALATCVLAALLLRAPQDLTLNPDLEPGSGTVAVEVSAQQVEMAIEDLRMLEELYGTGAQEDSQSNRL